MMKKGWMKEDAVQIAAFRALLVKMGGKVTFTHKELIGVTDDFLHVHSRNGKTKITFAIVDVPARDCLLHKRHQ